MIFEGKNPEFILQEENLIYLFGKRKSYGFNLMDFFLSGSNGYYGKEIEKYEIKGINNLFF